MITMSPTQINEFLQASRHAVIGVNRPEGPPHLSPVWYLYEDGVFYISIATTTVKYRLLQRDPRVSLCIDGGHPDYRTVIVAGVAELRPNDEAVRRRIIRRYYETEADAQCYAESTRGASNVLLVVRAERVIGQDYT
jgi:PPOX class probable F420-dependent enzyme